MVSSSLLAMGSSKTEALEGKRREARGQKEEKREEALCQSMAGGSPSKNLR